MLARIYFIAGSLLLAGYGVCCWEGWEFGDPLRLVPAPAAGAALYSSNGRVYHTNSSGSGSGSRSGWIIWGGK